jgi:hypothetical protein
MTRLVNAWRALAPDQQLAALAALGLFVSMFLPWYDKTDTVVVRGAAKATQTSLSAFQAFSFVEAAVLLVSAGVLVMLFERAEGRSFQLPGGDGVVVLAAGAWTALLIFYRLLDKPGLEGTDRITATVGVEWGIFIALLLALAVAYAGGRMRALERPGPPLRRPRGRGADPSPPAGPRPRPPMDPQPAGGPRRPMSAPLLVDPQPPRGAAPVPADLDATVVTPGSARRPRPTPVAAREPGPARGRRAARERGERPRYPPAPPEQLSFEDPE